MTAEMQSNVMQTKHRINAARIDPRDYFKFLDVSGKGYLSARCFQ